jgi:putative transposase
LVTISVEGAVSVPKRYPQELRRKVLDLVAAGRPNAQIAAERSYGIAERDLTPAQGWSWPAGPAPRMPADPNIRWWGRTSESRICWWSPPRTGPKSAALARRNRWQRANAQVGRIHAKVAAIRADEIHKATTAPATGHEVVAVEQLSAKNMARRGGRRKHGLDRAPGDAAVGRIRTQLDYKSTWYGTTLVIAPRCIPSTQLCSRRGAKTKLRLRDRVYQCRNGCPPIVRDLNAAINLARLGDPTTGGTGTGTDS